MKYRINGADDWTGAERQAIIEADDETVALGLAKEQGIFPYSVEAISIRAATPIASRPRRKTRSERKQDEKVVAAVVAGVFMFLLILGIIIIGSWFSGDHSAQHGYMPTNEPSPAQTGRPSIRIGATYSINVTSLGAISESALDKCEEIVRSHDDTALKQMLNDGEVIPLEAGTRVTVEDATMFTGKAKVRPSGSYKSVWIFSAWVD